MELPQPRAFGNEGGRPLRDFLSLYSQSAVQQDPTRQHQGNFPKTHDFFQPLEPATKAGGKVERAVETTEKTPPLSPPPPGQHLLPGGIGTYSIRHAATYFNPKAPKTEATRFSPAQASSPDRNEENSYCDSYTGSGFTLWEEPAMRKGEWGEEETPISTSEPSANIAQRTSELSPSNHHSCNSLSCYQRPSAHKKQSFLEAVKSPRSNGEDEEDDEEDFVQKKEGFIYEGKLHAVVDRKSIGQKPNTARSKHSATEQRRRSKINERFQMLRELIPHRDQKRDKASFLLEVIEYIQFLQEKVHGYEGSPQGWDHESAKLMAPRNGHRPAKRIIDHSQAISCSSGQPLLFATKIEEDNIIASPSIPLSVPSNPLESDLSKATTFRAMDNHSMPSQPPIFGNLTSDSDSTLFKPPSQLLQTRPADKPNDRDLAIEAGTVGISSLYSQGLLSTLRQALQNSGVDLSQASLSVQIDLAKQLNNRPIAPTSIMKEEEVPLSNQPCSRTEVGSGADRYDQAFKRLKRSEC